ncbi:MAG: hypothetical protein ACK559_04685, partial [bacterium]
MRAPSGRSARRPVAAGHHRVAQAAAEAHDSGSHRPAAPCSTHRSRHAVRSGSTASAPVPPCQRRLRHGQDDRGATPTAASCRQ